MNRKTLFSQTVLAIAFFLLSNPASALTDGADLTTGAVWSSWWWPNAPASLNMWGTDQALERLDEYSGRTTAEESSAIWEFQNHGPNNSPFGWNGHCHAWSSAAIWEDQPTLPETHSGVEFRVRDKKALLTEVYSNSTKYYQFNDMDPTPGTFWLRLKKEIGGLNPVNEGIPLPVIVEIDPSEAVWHQPVYKYAVSYEISGGKASGNIKIWYADDLNYSYADKTEVFTQSKIYAFYDVTMLGEIPKKDTGVWDASSHPDSIWRSKPRTPDIPWTQYSTNKKMKHEYLNVILAECTADEIILDGKAGKGGIGSWTKPFADFREAFSEVCDQGVLTIEGSDSSGQVYSVGSEPLNKSMTIRSNGGPVTLTSL